MAEPIRYHLDENRSSHAIVEALRSRGIDVTTTQDVCLGGATDQQQLAFGLAHQRVLFTHDGDYLKLHGSGVPLAGIVYCHQDAFNVGEIIDWLVLIWSVYSTEEMKNRVEYVSR